VHRGEHVHVAYLRLDRVAAGRPADVPTVDDLDRTVRY